MNNITNYNFIITKYSPNHSLFYCFQPLLPKVISKSPYSHSTGLISPNKGEEGSTLVKAKGRGNKSRRYSLSLSSRLTPNLINEVNKQKIVSSQELPTVTLAPYRGSVTFPSGKVIKTKLGKQATNLGNNVPPFFNFTFDKGRLKNLVSWTLENYGEYKTVELLEQLKKTGFEYATKAGISLGIEDLKIPPKKTSLLLEAEQLTKLTVHQYQRGDITAVERFKRLIDTWHRTSEQLKQEVISYFEETDILNPVYMMAFSGARGNISQVRQLVGMRGLMSDPQGQIIDFPIRSNFREGLTLTEYIISSYGSRKGIVDTALRTANAGYLTRRLVDVAQHVIIQQYDCGTQRGIFLTDMKEGNKTILSLQSRLIGRVLAKDIYKHSSSSQAKLGSKVGSFVNGIVKNQQELIKIAPRNQEISSKLALEISTVTSKVFVRSSLTCKTTKRICQLCYGWSLAQGKLVSVGETVGVIAAQSIGEPGTQLTMRTFHTGGVFSGDVSDEIRAPYDGFVEYQSSIPGILVRSLDGKIAFLTKSDGMLILKKKDSVKKDIKQYKIPPYTVLFMRNGGQFFKKQVIAQITNVSTQTNARDTVEFTIYADFEGLFYSKNLDLQKKIIGPFPKSSSKTKGFLIDPKAMHYELESKNWNFAWVLSGKSYEMPFFANLYPILGDFVSSKTIMTQNIWIKNTQGWLNRSSREKLGNYTHFQPFLNPNNKKYHLLSTISGTSSLFTQKLNKLNKQKQVTPIHVGKSQLSSYLPLLTPTGLVFTSKACLTKEVSKKVSTSKQSLLKFLGEHKSFKKSVKKNASVVIFKNLLSLNVKKIRYNNIGYFFNQTTNNNFLKKINSTFLKPPTSLPFTLTGGTSTNVLFFSTVSGTQKSLFPLYSGLCLPPWRYGKEKDVKAKTSKACIPFNINKYKPIDCFYMTPVQLETSPFKKKKIRNLNKKN